MARKSRDPALERAWRERVARWAASGLSVRAFCRQQGLIETSFYYWKRELRAREATAETPPAIAPVKSPMSPPRQQPVVKKFAPMFVPVTVLPGLTLSVEVRCPSGHVVLVSACDLASLSSLLAALTPPERETRSC